MIRKILLLFALLSAAVWIAGAHVIKNKTILLVRSFNSDNVKISFDEAQISGFPFAWQITLTAPKITVINQQGLQEVSIDEIFFHHTLFLSQINLGKNLFYNILNPEEKKGYSLVTTQDVIFDIKWTNILFFFNKNLRWKNHLQSISFSAPIISCITEDKEVFKLNSTKALLSKQKNNITDITKLQLMADLISTHPNIQIDNANLLLDINYSNNEEFSNFNFMHTINFNNFHLKIDNAAIQMQGLINLNNSAPPKGKLEFNLVQYHDIIDKLVPDELILSKPLIKNIISRASINALNKNNIGNANFEVVFSDKRINIGKINLLELQKN